MSNRKLILIALSAFTLSNISAVYVDPFENPNKAIVEKIVTDEYNRTNEGQEPLFNWNKVFSAIDKYKIDPTVLQIAPGSLLRLAISINRYLEDTGGSKQGQDEALRAIKTLLEKYRIFKKYTCGRDNCDQLIALALELNRSEDERKPNLEIVDLLLKHGAKPNRQTINNIKVAYETENVSYENGKVRKVILPFPSINARIMKFKQ